MNHYGELKCFGSCLFGEKNMLAYNCISKRVGIIHYIFFIEHPNINSATTLHIYYEYIIIVLIITSSNVVHRL